MTTTTKQPTVSVRIGDSTLTKAENGEILETVDYLADGQPDWESAGICDERGGGGEEGFSLLVTALAAAERNAKAVGYEEIVRIG